MSVQVSYKKQTIFYILLLIIVLAVAEGIVQIWWYEIRTCGFEDSPIFEDLDPELKREICVEHSETTRTDDVLVVNQHNYNTFTNSHGLRGPEFSLEKPPETYRIIMVGGSTTWGVVVGDSETIPSFLQQKFDNSKLDFKVEIINAGVNGAQSSNEVELIKNKLLDYEPDLFVVYDGWNDLADQHPAYQWTTGVIAGEFPFEQTDSEDFFSKFYPNIREYISFYKTPVALMYFLSSMQSEGMYPTNDMVADEELKNIIQNWKDNWAGICELGEKSGFDTLVTVQPIPGTGDRALTQFEYNTAKFFHDRAILPAYDQFTDSLKDLDGKCTKTADLRDVFDGISEPIYFDMIHVAAKGNWIVSERMFEEILPIVLAENNTKLKPEDVITSKNEKTDLSGTDLKGLNISGKNLSGLDLSNKDFSDSNFEFVDLTNTNLSHSNLTSARISNTIIFNTDFSYSDLKMATLRFTNLTSANFEGSNLIKTSFDNSDLSRLNLSGFDLTSVGFTFADLNRVDFTNADMSFTDLNQADLTGSKLIGANLTGSNLEASIGSQFIDCIGHHLCEKTPDWNTLNLVQGGIMAIDWIDNIFAEEDQIINIDKKTKQSIQIKGWAADNLAEDGSVKTFLAFKNEKRETTFHTIKSDRPDLVQAFGIENYIQAGWESTIDIEKFEKGCYELSIRIPRADSQEYFEISGNRTVCFD